MCAALTSGMLGTCICGPGGRDVYVRLWWPVCVCESLVAGMCMRGPGGRYVYGRPWRPVCATLTAGMNQLEFWPRHVNMYNVMNMFVCAIEKIFQISTHLTMLPFCVSHRR